MRVITAFRLLTITTIFQISSTTNPQFGIVPLPNISVCTPLRTNQQYFVAEPTPCVKKQLTHKNQCNIQLFEPSLSHIKIKAFACSMTIHTFQSVFYFLGERFTERGDKVQHPLPSSDCHFLATTKTLPAFGKLPKSMTTCMLLITLFAPGMYGYLLLLVRI